jgi:hypothetical protein
MHVKNLAHKKESPQMNFLARGHLIPMRSQRPNSDCKDLRAQLQSHRTLTLAGPRKRKEMRTTVTLSMSQRISSENSLTVTIWRI